MKKLSFAFSLFMFGSLYAQNNQELLDVKMQLLDTKLQLLDTKLQALDNNPKLLDEKLRALDAALKQAYHTSAMPVIQEVILFGKMINSKRGKSGNISMYSPEEQLSGNNSFLPRYFAWIFTQEECCA